MEFKTTLKKFNTNLWAYHIEVPEKAVKKFSEGIQRRVVCHLNNKIKFQCAIIPNKKVGNFININKKIRDQLKLKIGSEVSVKLEKDNSKYGLAMPEELQELLNQDKEGNRLFHNLTKGKQRTLIYIAGNVKNIDKRIARALAIMQHLKNNNGNIDFKILQNDIKNSLKL